MTLRSQAFKIGLAIFLCILVSEIFNLKYPFFVALPALIPITDTPFQTFTLGRNRIIGSISGAIIGILLAFIKRGSAILSGIGVILIFYLNKWIKLSNTTAVAILVFISIFVGFQNITALSFSWIRLLDTFVGIFVVFIVNNVIFRVSPNYYLREKCQTVFHKLIPELKKMVCEAKTVDLHDIEKKVNDIRTHHKNYRAELKLKYEKRRKLPVEDMIPIVYILFEHTKIINYMKVRNVNLENGEKIKTILECNAQTNDGDDTLNIVFNYHLGIILDHIKEYNDKIKNCG